MKKLFLIFIVLLFFTGCITTSKHTTTKEQYYQAKITALENQIQQLQKKIDLLETQKSEAKSESEKSAILSELSALSSKQQENINYLEQIKKDIYEIKSNLDKSKTSKTYEDYRKKRIYKKKVYRKKVTKPEDIYTTCYNLYSKGKFYTAEKCFNKFISKYPKNDLVANAYFWIGETYFERKNYSKAIDYYDIILTKFLNSEKVPSALLKEGLAFYNLNDKEGAKIFLEKVMSDYPSTPQATYAKKYLYKYNLK